jgi:hypothetical protein
VPASRLADIGTGDPQPLVLGRGDEHPLQQLAVGRLNLGSPGEGVAGRSDPCRQGIANLLQLSQPDQPWLTRSCRD